MMMLPAKERAAGAAGNKKHGGGGNAQQVQYSGKRLMQILHENPRGSLPDGFIPEIPSFSNPEELVQVMNSQNALRAATVHGARTPEVFFALRSLNPSQWSL